MHRRGFLLGAVLLAGCAGRATIPRQPSGGFEPRQLAKTDIDRVTDVHHREIFAGLRRIAEKLYRRNPREWRKGGLPDAEGAVARLFDRPHRWWLAEFGEHRGIEVLQLAFREDFGGDRVGAFVAGLAGMVHAAFDDKEEFLVADELNPQYLHNSARNVEIAMWRLANSRDREGNLLLLSNDAGPPPNLSFEREFGKIVGSLDVLAKVLAEKSDRIVVRVAQSLATAVFLPVK